MAKTFMPWERGVTGVGKTFIPKIEYDAPDESYMGLARRRYGGMPEGVRSMLPDYDAAEYLKWKDVNRVSEMADSPELVRAFMGQNQAPSMAEAMGEARGAGRAVINPMTLSGGRGYAFATVPAGVTGRQAQAPALTPKAIMGAGEPGVTAEGMGRAVFPEMPAGMSAGIMAPFAEGANRIAAEQSPAAVMQGGAVAPAPAAARPVSEVAQVTPAQAMGAPGVPTPAAGRPVSPSMEKGVTGLTKGIEDLLVMRGALGRDTHNRSVAADIMGRREGRRLEGVGLGEAEKGRTLELEKAKLAAAGMSPTVMRTPGGAEVVTMGKTVLPIKNAAPKAMDQMNDSELISMYRKTLPNMYQQLDEKTNAEMAGMRDKAVAEMQKRNLMPPKTEFATPEEANAAGLPKGTPITVAGRRAVVE